MIDPWNEKLSPLLRRCSEKEKPQKNARFDKFLPIYGTWEAYYIYLNAP